VAEKLAAAVEPFGCQLVEGVLSHDLKQFVLDGNKVRLPLWGAPEGGGGGRLAVGEASVAFDWRRGMRQPT